MTAATVDTAIRLGASAIPVAVLVGVVVVCRPGLRVRMAALLAGIAATVGIVLLNAVAASAGWWTFTEGGPLGAPTDLLLAWAVLWGPLPVLLDRWPLAQTLAVLAAIDLLTLPLLPGLGLGGSWVVGEVAGLAVVATPAIMLGRFTARRRHLTVRVFLQVTVTGALLFGLAPLAAARLGDHLAVQGGMVGWIGGQVVLVGVVMSLAAVREFLVRGQGTPWPWDPPRRVVTSGPYRHLANPMQVGGVLVLVGLGAWLGSWRLVAMGVVGALFAATSARLHEDTTVARRHPQAWPAYRATVRNWAPRWRPAVPDRAVGATLWVADGCGPCTALGAWVARQAPVGLIIRPAEDLPAGPPRRATYIGADGHVATGVAAFAHATEHLHLGWAAIGWFLRLPVVRTVSATIADAVGFGPQELVPPQEVCRDRVGA